jgi:hypothetical protein
VRVQKEIRATEIKEERTMKIGMCVPVSRINEAMNLANDALKISSFEEAWEWAEKLGGYTDYGGTCGDRDHIGDFIGGAITGYIAEKCEIDELDGEIVEIVAG